MHTTVANGYTHTIGTVSSVLKTIICAEGEQYEKMLELVYADQSPHGKSAEANLVRNRSLWPQDVGWLYIKNFNGKKLWLGKIVKGRPIPFKKGEYKSATRELLLSL